MNAIFEFLWSFVLIFYYVFESMAKTILPSWFEKSVRDQIVVITGGGSGIGRLLAFEFAKRGAIVVSIDVNGAANEETVRKITSDGGKAYSYVCDLTDRYSIYETSEQIRNEVGTAQILINNAGIVSGAPLLETKDEKIIKIFDTNILAHFWTLKEFLPGMIKEKKGHVVTISSIAGHFTINQMTDYCSSKFATVGLDEALRSELFFQGLSDQIKCTAVCPYFINTGMFDGVQSKLVSIMTPEYVVEKIMTGILTNAEMVFIPRWFSLLLILKALFPTKAYLEFSKATGFNSAMQTYRGRPKTE